MKPVRARQLIENFVWHNWNAKWQYSLHYNIFDVSTFSSLVWYCDILDLSLSLSFHFARDQTWGDSDKSSRCSSHFTYLGITLLLLLYTTPSILQFFYSRIVLKLIRSQSGHWFLTHSQIWCNIIEKSRQMTRLEKTFQSVIQYLSTKELARASFLNPQMVIF